VTRDDSQSHFYKIFKHLTDKPSYFPHKEISFFASVAHNWCSHKFLFWLCLLVVLC